MRSKPRATDTISPLPKEEWLHACAVADHKDVPLGGMIYSCYCYEEMAIKELTEKGCHSANSMSLLRAWVCVFFDVLSIMVKDKYKNCCLSCIKGCRMKDIEKIKEEIVFVRSLLSKLKLPNVDKTEQKGELILVLYGGYPFTFGLVPDDSGVPTREVNIQEVSKKFISILSDCEVPKANEHWLRIDRM